MNTREKIFVIVTIAVAMGAGLFLLFDQDAGRRPQKQTQSQGQAPSQEALDILQNQKAKQEDIKPSEFRLQRHDQRVIKAASRPWPQKIFHNSGPAPVQDRQASALHYSGFMQTNDQYVAIINGRPFAPGEYLDGTGWPEYRVESITSQEVILRTPQGEQRTLVLQADASFGLHTSRAMAGSGKKQ